MSIYDQVKQALQDVVAPELKMIQAEIKRLDEKSDSSSEKFTVQINSLRAEVTTEIKRLDEKFTAQIDSLKSGVTAQTKSIELLNDKLTTQINSSRAEVTTEIRRLDEKMDIAIQIRERLVALEARFATQRGRLRKVEK